LITPVDGAAQRSVPFGHVTGTVLEQYKAVVQAGGQTSKRKMSDAGCGKFDGQR
jgi:hypothetical protein